MISYKTIKANSRLTDFDETKVLVISNMVRNVPSELKCKCSCVDGCLSDFC